MSCCSDRDSRIPAEKTRPDLQGGGGASDSKFKDNGDKRIPSGLQANCGPPACCC